MTARPQPKSTPLISILASAAVSALAFVLVPELTMSNLAIAESSQQFVNGFGHFAPVFSSLNLSANEWLSVSHYLNPIFLFIALLLPFWRFAKKEKWIEIAILACTVLGSHQILYFSQWSPAYSAGILGIVFVLESKYFKNRIPRITTISLGLFLAFCFSFWVWPLLVWLIVYGVIWRAKQLKNTGLGITISAALAFSIMPNYLELLQSYLSEASRQFIFHDGQAILAENLSNSHGLGRLLANINPIFLLLLALPLLSQFRHQLIPSFVFLILSLAASLINPLASGHDGFALSVILLPVVLLLLQFQGDNNKVKYALLGLTLVFGLLTGHFTQGYAGYYQPGLLSFQNRFDKITSQESDYLNISGFQFKQKYPQVSSNFETEDPQQPLLYERQSRKGKSLIISRFGEQKYLINSAAFPPNGIIERSKNSEDLTMVVLSAPVKSIANAFKLIEKKDYGSAIVRFRELSDSLPNNPEVWYGFSRSQFLFSEWDDALKTCNNGLSLAPQHTELLCLKSEILLKRNQRIPALAFLRKSRLADANYARPYWLKALTLIDKDSLEEAKSWLKDAWPLAMGEMKKRVEKTQKLIELKGQEPFNYMGIADYFIQKINQTSKQNQVSLSQIKAIESELKSMIDLDSTNAILRSHLGVLYMMKQDYARAAQAFEKGVALNPNYPQMRKYMVVARINWGTQEFEQDSLQAALFNFSYALDYDATNQSALYNMAATHTELAKKSLESGDIETAYGHLKAALKFNQAYSDAYLTMGYLQQQKNEADSAEIAFNQAYLTDKKNADAIEELIRIYREQGETYKVKVYQDRLNKARKE